MKNKGAVGALILALLVLALLVSSGRVERLFRFWFCGRIKSGVKPVSSGV